MIVEMTTEHGTHYVLNTSTYELLSIAPGKRPVPMRVVQLHDAGKGKPLDISVEYQGRPQRLRTSPLTNYTVSEDEVLPRTVAVQGAVVAAATLDGSEIAREYLDVRVSNGTRGGHAKLYLTRAGARGGLFAMLDGVGIPATEFRISQRQLARLVPNAAQPRPGMRGAVVYPTVGEAHRPVRLEVRPV